MKTILFIIALVFTMNISAQTYKIVGDKLVKVETTTAKADEKTELTVTIKDVTYPVYESARGKFYIIRTSKNTGKKYKQYLKIEL